MIILRQSFITAIVIIILASSSNAIKNDDDFFVRGSNSMSYSNDSTPKFVCTSKDKDAALVWNYNDKRNDSKGGGILSTDFVPRKATREDNANCAVWNSTQCVARWEEKGDWNVVDSIVEPMGPVHDYRWEDFNELRFDEVRQSYQEYRYVATFNESTDMVVFSVRGSEDVDFYFCDSGNPLKDSCIKIIIGASGSKESKILSCVNLAIGPRPKVCTTLANVKHELAIVDEYEWRTFRIKWNTDDRKTIKVFKGTEIEPFLEGNLDQWYRAIFNLSVKSEMGTRIRFHFYEYLSTSAKNAVLSTTEFDQYDENFCIKLFAGICFECQLKVTLVDSNGDEFPVGMIRGGGKLVNDSTLVWRTIKLTAKLPIINISRRLKIKVQTVLEEYQGHERWAMDELRMCESADTARESIVTINREIASPFLSRINCQKLSYIGSERINLSSVINERANKSQSVREMKTKSRSMEHFKLRSKRSSFALEDLKAVSGHQTSVILSRKPSSSTNGNERQRRSTKDGLEKIENLKATGTSDTNVTIRWKLPNKKIRHFEVIVKVNEFLGCSDRNESSPAIQPIVRDVTAKAEELSFEGLHPYTNYTTTVIAYINDHEGFKGELNFTTLQSNIPTEKIQNLRYDASTEKLTWDAPDCADMTGPWAKTNISFADNGRYVSGKSVSSDILQITLQHVDKLRAYTTYEVRAYIARSNETPDESAAHSEEINAKRPAAPPGKVNKMGAFNIDVENGTISFFWDLPDPLNGEIESYHLEINHDEDEMPLLDETYKTPEQVSKCKLWEEFVCLENVRLETNFSGPLRAKISAKNKDVEEQGPEATDIVLGSDWRNTYFKPFHLNETIEDDGLVTVRWKHPSRPMLKIARFKIQAKLLESTLLNTNDHIQKTRKAIYPVKQEKKEYNQLFYLTTSSRYNISVIAESEQKTHIGIVDSYDLRVPFQAGFASGKKVQLACNGVIRELEIPAIVNATQNTTVFITAVRKINQISTEELSLNYKVENVKRRQLTLNFSQKYSITDNSAENEVYQIIVIATDLKTGENTTIETTEHLTCDSADPCMPDPKQPSIIGPVMICLIIITILLVSFLVWYRKFRHSSKGPDNAPLKPPPPAGGGNITFPRSPNESTPPASLLEMQIPMQHKVPDLVPYNPHSWPVKVEEFEKYAKEALSLGLLNKQYTEFERGLQKSYEYGTLQENMSKNRYKNQIAYDETRIVLKKLDDDPYSDYINANYIEGHRNPRAYIATQGPLKATVNDFWRMVWQENVSVICMLANTVEGGKKKCEEYWPNVEGTNKKCGEILIRNTDTDVFADYTFRTLTLTYKGDKRRVTHLHYTGWPDHGVPMYTQSLVAYLNKLQATDPGKGPVVVHCSAGVGRTGTIILCDSCLRQAATDKTIDAPATIIKMREGRGNMVDSAQQYMLGHLAIVESIIAAQTQVPCSYDFPDKIKELRKQLSSDLARLNDTVWQDRVLHALASPPPLSTGTSGNDEPTRDVANEDDPVAVDGVKMKNQYLAYRLPSPTTIPYHWQLVALNKVELIVTLQCPARKSSSYCNIISDDFVFFPTPDIKVEKKSKTDNEHFTIDKLILTDTSNKDEATLQPVTVITCKDWKCDGTGKPPSVTALVTLWRESEKIRRDVAPTLVLCQDGATACGLYLALSFLLERMAVERECDVISAVRAVRRSRPDFVQSLEQFNYLYDAAINYHESFATYSNFS